MMRSMFSGVSGLRAHQSKMDVIGNNIANVNTVGFKSGRVTFQEIFNQTLRGAGAPDMSSGRGGTNPMQVGLGIGVGAVDTITARGSLQRTDNPTDLSIDGDGFFIVRGGSGDTYRFTRAGNFGIDKLGNLVTASGMNVQGWQHYKRNTDGSYDFYTEEPIEPLNLYSDVSNGNKRMIAAKATTSIELTGNMDARFADVKTKNGGTEIRMTDDVPTSNTKMGIVGKDSFSIPMIVYDKLGNSYKMNIKLVKNLVDTVNNQTEWYWQIPDSTDYSITKTADTTGAQITGSVGGEGMLLFDKDGKLISDATTPLTTGRMKMFQITVKPASSKGTDPFVVTLDLAKISQYSADSSAKPTSIDGYPSGNLVTFNIGSDGILTGIYSNGQQQPIGLTGLASFENPAGLQKVGDNMFIPTTNSGDFKKAVKAGAEGAGTLNPGTLEMSNVDLSKEFTEMIVTQRGFQANSRIITTSDEMLQELVNLKR